MKARNKKSTYAAVERNVGHAREKLGIKWFQLLIAVLTITFCFGMGGHAAASEDWTWVNAKPDHIPPDAVYGGQEGQQSLYICRAGYQNGIHPGKVRPGFGGCNIAYGGAEVTVPNFQILVSSWVPSANGSVPPGASAFGNEAADAGKLPLFVCRAAHNGIHPGKVRPGLGGCNIAYGGAEITASTFWDLLHPRWIPNDDNIHGPSLKQAKKQMEAHYTFAVRRWVGFIQENLGPVLGVATLVGEGRSLRWGNIRC